MSETTRPWWAMGCSPDLTERDLRNLRALNLRLFAMMALLMLTLFVIRRDAFGIGAWAAVTAVLPSVAFVAVWRAARTFLDEADELTRRIQIQAMAAGGAGAFVAWALQSVLEATVGQLGDPRWATGVLEVLSPMMGLAVGYVAAVLIQQRRYGG